MSSKNDMDGFSLGVWCKINSLLCKKQQQQQQQQNQSRQKNSANSFVLKAKSIFAHHICYEGQNAPS